MTHRDTFRLDGKNQLTAAQLGRLVHLAATTERSLSNIGAEFGVTAQVVQHHRDLRLRGNRTHQRWTPAEIDLLIDGTSDGLCPWALSYHLKRSIESVRHRLKLLRESGRLTAHDEPLSLHQVGAIMGFRRGKGYLGRDAMTYLRRWIAAGALVAHDAGAAGRCLTSLDNVWDFLHDEAWWPEWNPFRLTIPQWRQELIERRGLGGYLSTAEIVARYGFPESTVRRHIRAGTLPAVRLPWHKGVTYYAHYLAIESHDWSRCQVPTRRGRDYGRLRHPPQVRRDRLPLRRTA